ncbi:MAG: DNA-3-methyladenine glycosylase, partial [bacterium]
GDEPRGTYYNKVTKRNLAEYLRGGHIYIYLVYGNYYQLNITTYKEGYPECVLIRSLEPILNLKNPKGPGKLCEELKLDSSFWGEDLITSKRIWLENGENIKRKDIISTTRIGIDYAEECKFLKWRFYIKNNPWVSKK